MTASKNGLFARPFELEDAEVLLVLWERCWSWWSSPSPSEEGTCRRDVVLERGLGAREELRRLGGAPKRRLTVEWVSFSYSTEVERGMTFLRVVPEAHASLGFMISVLVLLLLSSLVLVG